MQSRIERFLDPIDPAITAAAVVDLAPAVSEIIARLRPGAAAPFDLSVAGRMAFSCLVDADFRDTEAFHARLEGRARRTATGLPCPPCCRGCVRPSTRIWRGSRRRPA